LDNFFDEIKKKEKNKNNEFEFCDFVALIKNFYYDSFDLHKELIFLYNNEHLKIFDSICDFDLSKEKLKFNCTGDFVILVKNFLFLMFLVLFFR
jgi:hypothetical protein